MSELVAEQIERVDEIPVVFHILIKMGIAERIDRFWPAHGNWKGLRACEKTPRRFNPL